VKRAIFVVACFLALVGDNYSQTQIASTAAPIDKSQILWNRLKAKIDETEHDFDGVMGVAIEDLTSRQTLFLHPDEVFPQASSIKIAVLAELYHQAELSNHGAIGKARLTDSYTVQAADIVPDSDILQGLTPSVTRLTNRDLVTMMVAVSDNSAANVLIDRVGMDNINALLESVGLKHTHLQRKMMDLKAAQAGRENISTPREMMQLLEAIYQGKVASQPLTEDLLKVLSTPKDSWIPRDLPADLRIANKPGALEGVRNDSGIVFVQNRPFVICIMTTYLRNEREGEKVITDIAAEAFHMFDRLGRASKYGRVISLNNSSKP
jgi:beta-lactamase class A